MRKFRMATVGLGHRGRQMLCDVARCVDCIDAVAVCDLNPDLFYKPVHFYYGGDMPPLKEELPALHFYTDYEEMLDTEKPDVVMVETPAQCHAQFCALALKRGIHVYSDIPTVGTLEDADMLWKVRKESDAMLMTGATTCGWGFVLALQDLCKQGFLGKPFFLEAEYIHDCRMLWEETPWRRPGPDNKPNPAYYCTHSLGPLLSVIDEDLRTVSCVSSGSFVSGNPWAEDICSATFQTDSGVIVRMTKSGVNNAKIGHHSYRVFGSEGYFEHLSERGSEPARTRFNSTKLYGANKLTELPVTFTPNEGEEWNHKRPRSTFGHGGADAWLWYKFAEALQAGAKEAPLDLKAGLRMTLPGIFAGESIKRKGEIVKLHYPWDND